METATMGRFKSKPKGKESGVRPTALTIKGSLEWRAWVELGAQHCRTDVSKLIDAALVTYLKDRGFDKAPPKR